MIDISKYSNYEAETNILSIFFDNKEFLDDTEIKRTDFYFDEHQKVFMAMQHLYHNHTAISLATLKETLGTSVSIQTLSEITSNFSSTATFSTYKKILIDHAMRRRIVILTQGLLTRMDEYNEIDVLLDKVENAFLSVRRDVSDITLPDMQDIVLETYNNILKDIENPGQLKGISTGFQDIDLYIGGLQKKTLYYIGARPSMGKTALLSQICLNVAKQGKVVVFFSLEMSEEKIIRRYISQETVIERDKIDLGLINQDELKKITDVSQQLSNLPLVIIENATINTNQMRNIIKKVKKKYGRVDLIAIDYLQYIQDQHKDRRIAVEENSRALKTMCKDFDTPVVCLAQLSRATEMRKDQRPILSDLKEAGGIEADADVVAFLYREGYYDKSIQDCLAELIIAKQRDGRLGTIKLGWIGECTLFVDYKKLEQNRKE